MGVIIGFMETNVKVWSYFLFVHSSESFTSELTDKLREVDSTFIKFVELIEFLFKHETYFARSKI